MGLQIPQSSALQVERIGKLAQTDDDIVAVVLFGSHARGEGSAVSDVDICIFLRPRKYAAAEIHGKRLSYQEVVSDKVDIQVFQQLPVPVRSQILKEAKKILVKDEDELYRIAFETVRELEDFRRHYNEYLAGVMNAAEG